MDSGALNAADMHLMELREASAAAGELVTVAHAVCAFSDAVVDGGALV